MEIEGRVQVSTIRTMIGGSRKEAIACFEIVDDELDCNFRIEDLIKLEGKKVKIIVEDDAFYESNEGDKNGM